MIKTRLGRSFTRAIIKADEDSSVQVAAYALESLRLGFKSRDPEVAYKVGYGGGTPEGRKQFLGKFDHRTRGDIVDGVWQAGLDLVACPDWNDTARVRAALMKARAATDDIFDALLV